MFSQRLAWDAPENELARLAAHKRGTDFIDLTESNPTPVGLPYPEADLRLALAPEGLARYEPSPRGILSARAAVAADYARRGVTIDPRHIVLTSSSSESYGLLFKLLCDPGDAVLVPEPSYPLFDYLARLEGIEPRRYRLNREDLWHRDFESLEVATSDRRVRAVIVVSPNNPTGSFLREGDFARLESMCAKHDLVLIADEVFADYDDSAPPDRVRCAAAEARNALTFSLGGLSKSCGLPQLKLGWLVVGGPPAAIEQALTRLDLVADTYLSVATPVQLGLPRLLEIGADLRTSIRKRVAENRAALAAAIGPDSPCTLLPAEGGWSAILRVPQTRSDEAWALALLSEHDVLVQPGYFFDMPSGVFLVVSLLPQPARFAEGIRRVMRAIE